MDFLRRVSPGTRTFLDMILYNKPFRDKLLEQAEPQRSKTMIVGVSKVICTCGEEMVRTGGTFGGGGDVVDRSTYGCTDCKKYVIVLTPAQSFQDEFAEKVAGR